MPLSAYFAIGGVLTLLLGGLAAYQLRPKLMARERRGEITRPVPDPQDSGTAGLRLLWLIWTVRTSADRPGFLRHVLLVRWAPIIGGILIAASIFAMKVETLSTAEDAANGPPPVTISVAE